MRALYFIAVAEIITYLVATIAAFGRVPKSISDTYYMWQEKGLRYLFTFVMWFTGIPILIYWVDVSYESIQFIPFLSISGMCFVGAAAAFKEQLTGAVHYTSAGIWAGFALLYFVLVEDWLALGIGGMVFVLMALLIGRKQFTFWAEVACVVMMIVGIYRL